MKDVLSVAEKYAKDLNLPAPHYNIEIKSRPDGDRIFHPEVAEFSEKVIKVVSETVGLERVNIQSFDFRGLNYIHANHPDVPLAMLVENAANCEEYLAELDFQPGIYSSYFLALKPEVVKSL